MNLYDLLGISQQATSEEIKIAFRNKAVKLHPDKGGSAEEFSKIRFAYEVLMDCDKRNTYDLTGEADPNFNPKIDALIFIKNIIREVIFSNSKDPLAQAKAICAEQIAFRQERKRILTEQSESINNARGQVRDKKIISKESKDKISGGDIDGDVMKELIEANEEKVNIFEEAYDEVSVEVDADLGLASRSLLVAIRANEILESYEKVT